MRTRKLKTDLGLSPCPKCGKGNSKPYILTEKKKRMRKCLRCRTDYTPKRKEGLTKFFVCQNHPWQKFKVGAEVIIAKARSKGERQIMEDVAIKAPYQAKNKPKGQRNVRA